jgi:Uma2 family endonuclease
MTALRDRQMSVDEFLAWAPNEPGRWELYDGVPNAMSPERVIHGDVKYRVARALDTAISAGRLPCHFVLDSAAVRVDAKTLYQPDALVYCGDALAGDTLIVANPIAVFEVLSPGNAMKDLRDKLQGYFRIPSVAHYLVVDPDKRIVIHHARGENDIVATRIAGAGELALDPPGLTLAVADLFP